jgi:hypothetical protein
MSDAAHRRRRQALPRVARPMKAQPGVCCAIEGPGPEVAEAGRPPARELPRVSAALPRRGPAAPAVWPADRRLLPPGQGPGRERRVEAPARRRGRASLGDVPQEALPALARDPNRPVPSPTLARRRFRCCSGAAGVVPRAALRRLSSRDGWHGRAVRRGSARIKAEGGGHLAPPSEMRCCCQKLTGHIPALRRHRSSWRTPRKQCT